MPMPAGATVPPWQYVAMGSCEHVVEAGTTYGPEIADKVPEAYRATWGSNDVNDKAKGKPDYGGYGWRWCGGFEPGSDVTVECEHFCDSLGDCAAVSAGQCCFPYKARCTEADITDKSKSQSYRYYERNEIGNWGWPLLGAVLLGSMLYVGGGGVAATMARGPDLGRRGLAAHPHYTRWQAAYALVIDGVAFALGRRSRAATPHTADSDDGRSSTRSLRQPLAAAGSAPGKNPAVQSDAKARARSKNEKGKEKERGKSKKGKEPRKGKQDQTDPEPPPAQQPPAAAPEWKPTRTGHLAIGARETGVKVVM